LAASGARFLNPAGAPRSDACEAKAIDCAENMRPIGSHEPSPAKPSRRKKWRRDEKALNEGNTFEPPLINNRKSICRSS
jgi:hypothetical protein